jgi:hypothetical protein
MDDQKQKPEQAQDQTATATLAKEQLRGLLNSFLDQLIASKPPGSPSRDQQPRPRPQQPQPGQKYMPTPEELFEGYQRGGEQKLKKMLGNMPEKNDE